MELLGKILRTVSLAILFGGSVAIVFAAIVLVHANRVHGHTAAEAAASNAALFITFARVNLVFGVVLMVGEAIDYAKRKSWNKATVAQYACSLLCVVSTMIFALSIVPSMERMLPELQEDKTSRQQFHQLLRISRPVFGATIIFALLSLLLPIFGALPAAGKQPGTENA